MFLYVQDMLLLAIGLQRIYDLSDFARYLPEISGGLSGVVMFS